AMSGERRLGMKRRDVVLFGVVGCLLAGVAGCQVVLGFGDWVDAGGGTGGTGGGTASTGATGGGGTGGTGGVGGVGGSTVTECIPNEQVPCYTGPSGTEGKGTCKGGMATCNESGTGIGECMGQVVPGPEVPDVIGDEGCDGYTPGEPIWWRTFGDDKDQWPDAMASDQNGNIYVCGTFGGTLVFDDNEMLISQGTHNIFLVKLGTTGKAVWSKRFGNNSEQIGCNVAVDAQGNVLVAGAWFGTMSFGGNVLAPNPGPAIFAAKFDSDGNHKWSKMFNASFDTIVSSAAADPSTGDLLVAGSYSAYSELLNKSATTGQDMFVGRLSGGDGHVLWAKGFADGGTASDGDDIVDDVAVLGNGDIAIAGRYTGSVSLGAQTSLGPQNNVPFFWAKLNPQGDAVWAVDTMTDDAVSYIGVEGHVSDGALVGYFSQGLEYGYSLRHVAADNSSTDYLFGFDPGDPAAATFASGKDGAMAIALAEKTAADLGGGNLGPVAGGGGVANVLISKRDAAGAYSWSFGFGGPQLSGTDVQGFPVVTMLADGGVVVAMSFGGKAVVSGAVLSSAGQSGLGDLAVVRIAP
ncbi:MAG: hypothetical protein K1X57_21695, partial [Gemmataceae bacterium]|nr:hypothetical protein [Gemmataceae bacterium]